MKAEERNAVLEEAARMAELEQVAYAPTSREVRALVSAVKAIRALKAQPGVPEAEYHARSFCSRGLDGHKHGIEIARALVAPPAPHPEVVDRSPLDAALFERLRNYITANEHLTFAHADLLLRDIGRALLHAPIR